MECFFSLLIASKTFLYFDESSKRNPGVAGYDLVGRNSAGDFLVVVAGGLGIATNFLGRNIMAVL